MTPKQEDNHETDQSPPAPIALCGTEQPDVVGRTLTAGPTSVEFDNGQLRYLKVNGIEVLRAVAFLVRDENWGTYVPALSNLKVEQRADGFSVSYQAVCKRGSQEIAYDATIEGRADGSLEFRPALRHRRRISSPRALASSCCIRSKAWSAMRVEVEHVDGKVEKSKFPARVNPIQPFLHIRAR